MDVTRRPDPDDDDFAVYPFRRQLVEEHTQLIDAPQRPPAPPAPTRRPAARPRRPQRSPLRIALPVAAAVFIVAVAAAATLSGRHQVGQAIQQQIVPAAAEAAAKPRSRPVLQRPSLFVPDAVGLDRKHAVALLEQHGFRPRVKLAVGKPGRVLEQTPQAATEVTRTGVVVLVVGRAKPKPAPVVISSVIVTAVVGLDRDAAAHALLAEGLAVKIFGVRSGRPAGTVVAQDPPGGSRAESGSPVRINVAVN